VIRFEVHVHPGTRTSRAAGRHGEALNVHVRSRAIEGAATREVLEVIARAFNVRTSAVTLVRGTHSRQKLVEIDGDDDVVLERLAELLGT
jgi:uncharacterized protein (TIGR00251 family)